MEPAFSGIPPLAKSAQTSVIKRLQNCLLMAVQKHLDLERHGRTRRNGFTGSKSNALSLRSLRTKRPLADTNTLVFFHFDWNHAGAYEKQTIDLLLISLDLSAIGFRNLLKAAEDLTSKRRIAADDLSSRITEQLRDLEIPRAEFDVAFIRRRTSSSNTTLTFSVTITQILLSFSQNIIKFAPKNTGFCKVLIIRKEPFASHLPQDLSCNVHKVVRIAVCRISI